MSGSELKLRVYTPRPLTQKQETFCLEYIKSGNASDAYRQSYQCGGMKPASIHRRAIEMMCNSMIAARLAELRAPAVKKAQITFETHLRRLDSLRRHAQKLGQMSAAIAAEVARGKAAGLYVEKVEHSGDLGVSVKTYIPENGR